MFRHNYLKWFSIFYYQRRKIILEKWKNRNTITNQMNSKDLLINYTIPVPNYSFNETQKHIFNEKNKFYHGVYNHTCDDELMSERISRSLEFPS